MALSMVEVRKLEAVGGPLLQRYEELVSRAGCSQHLSPAFEELVAFERHWREHYAPLTVERVRDLVREEIAVAAQATGGAA
jgi:hypothetical protein